MFVMSLMKIKNQYAQMVGHELLNQFQVAMFMHQSIELTARRRQDSSQVMVDAATFIFT
jgi:hypothetical protein